MEQWCDVSAGFDPADPPLVCRQCQEKGAPPPDRFVRLSIPHRLALGCLLEAPTLREGIRNAAQRTGLTPDHIRSLLNGRRTPEFRRAFQLRLEQAGLTLDKMAVRAAECLDATEAKWNRQKGKFDQFPDYNTRLNAVRWGAQQLEVSAERDRGGTAVQVNVVHNFGAGEEIDPPGTMRVRTKEIE